MQSPRTTRSPIWPSFQKWLSDLFLLLEHIGFQIDKGGSDLPTNPRHQDMEQDFARTGLTDWRLLHLEALLRGDHQRGVWAQRAVVRGVAHGDGRGRSVDDVPLFSVHR